MRGTYYLLFVLTFYLSEATGQSIDRKCVPFDIMFWQKELRLNKVQRLQIYYINRDLYNLIYEMTLSDTVDKHNLQMALDLWRHSTFNLLSLKQKRKWKKIVKKYY